VTRTLDDLVVEGRTIAVRCDLNVPLAHADDGEVTITDDGRIRACLPTLRNLLDRRARVVVIAHLGRPKGVADPELSLRPIADRLAELLDTQVQFVPAVSGPTVVQAVSDMGDGDIVLLENVRFDPRETSKDPGERASLADEWCEWADMAVSDGFGVVHREQASVTDLPARLPHAAGLLVDAERRAFERVLINPDRPYVVILGGAKVSDKIKVIDNLLERVDRVLIGGGMAFTFLAAKGHEVGRSLLEQDMIDVVQRTLDRADSLGVDIMLPVDVVVAEQISDDAPTRTVPITEIPADALGLDIGPRTIANFTEAIAGARTIVWNGPMGVFESTPFAAGTQAVAQAVSRAEAFTVVGGGDSAAAIRTFGLADSAFGHISTGGGASLELLEGATLPGLAVLEEPDPD